MRIAIPTALDIPEPGLVPQHNDAKYKAIQIIDASPGVLTELDQSRGFILSTTQTPPALDLTFTKIRLLGQLCQLREATERNRPLVYPLVIYMYIERRIRTPALLRLPSHDPDELTWRMPSPMQEHLQLS